MHENTGWFELATSHKIVLRATKIAVVVGCLLAIINHGDAIYRRDISFDRIMKILLTFVVPYLVSTFSSISAVRELRREQNPAADLKSR